MLRKARWQSWPYDDCPECGANAEVFTTADAGNAYDGDAVRCFKCGLRGTITVDVGDQPYEAWAEWEDN